MSLKIGICHPDVKKRGGRRVFLDPKDEMDQNMRAALAEPRKLLVSIEIIPEASFVGLSAAEARALARGLLHQAEVIEQMIRAKDQVKAQS